MKTDYSKIRLINGSSVYATIDEYSYIPVECAFYGKADDGYYYYFWDVSKEGETRSFRISK